MNAPARARAAPSPRGGRLVQRKATVAARVDHHERQADQRASDFMAGVRHLSRGLTPAPAAGVALGDSVGEPLPTVLRASLELAFDARLAAVRIHRDAPAASAAQRLHARAFASGPRIYFGAGAWSPTTAAGRELIAHELTHVLQQAGRVAGGDLLEVRPVAADGVLQCKPAMTQGSNVGMQRELFSMIVAAYRGGSDQSDDADLEQSILQAGATLGERLVVDASKPGFAQGFRDAVAAGLYRKLKSAPARSFQFDCLKLLGYFPEAAALLVEDKGFKMRSVGPSDAFRKFLHDDPAFGRDWVGQFLEAKAFKPLWPDALMRSWRAFYLKPTEVAPTDAKLLAAANTAEADERSNIRPGVPSQHTEAYWLAWHLLAELDAERRQEQVKLYKRLVDLSRNRTIFEALRDELRAWQKSETEVATDNGKAGWQMRLAAAKLPLIAQALAFWNEALADYDAWSASLGLLSLEQLAADTPVDLPDGELAAAAATGLKTPFLKGVEDVFKLQTVDGTKVLPAPADYAQQLKAFLAGLLETPFSTGRKDKPAPWMAHLQELAIAEAMRDKPDRQRLAQIAILPLMGANLALLAVSYDAKADQKAAHFDDQRRWHRLALARACNAIGRWLGWSEVVGLTRAVLQGTEISELADTAQLLLVDDWQVDDAMPIAQMLADFPGNVDQPLLKDAPFTVTQLVEWYRFDYHHRMRETLEQLLLAETTLTRDTQLDFTALDHVKQTRKDVQASMGASAEAEYAIDTPSKLAIKSPQRFSVARFGLVVPPGAEFAWDDLIALHDKTIRQLGRRAHGLVFPTDPHQGVFAWALPPMDELLAALQSLPGVADIAARRSGESQEDWLDRLRPTKLGPDGKVPKADLHKVRLNATDWKRLNDVLARWIKVRAEHDESTLPGLWRRLVVMRRRWLAMFLKPRIQHFADNPYVSHGPSNETQAQTRQRLDTPELVVKTLRDFEGSARPARELPRGATAADVQAERERAQRAVDVQMVLLTLQLAPALLNIDRQQMGPYLRSHLYEYFQLAVDMAEDAKGLAALRGGLGDYDEAAAEVMPDERLKQTLAAMKAFNTAVEEDLRDRQDRHGLTSSDGKTLVSNIDAAGFPIQANPTGKRTETAAKEWHIHMSLTKDGEFDQTTGDAYRLIKVHRKFEYHPQGGALPNKRLRKGAGGAFSPAWLAVEDKGQTTRYEGDQLPDLRLFTMYIKREGREAEEVHVTARDTDLLDELEEVIFWRSYVVGNKELVRTFATVADWVVTVGAVFFPEIAAGEFIYKVGKMIKDGEIQDIVEQIKDDPIAFGEHLLGKIAELFEPGKIWQYVLFGGGQDSPLAMLEHFFAGRTHKVDPERDGNTSLLAKVVHALRTLWQDFVHALHVLHEYTQPPLRRVQGEVAMRPTLAWVMRRAVHLVELATELAPLLGSKDKSSALSALLGGNGESIQQDMSDRVVNLLEGVRHIQLPGELVNLTAATEIIISFILDRFGKRGKLLRMGLSTMPVPSEWGGGQPGQYTNALTFISKLIADHWWRHSALDPNNFWREKVLDKIGKKFEELKSELVDELYVLVNGALDLLGLDQVHAPTQGQVGETKVVEEPLLESEASAPGGLAGGQPHLEAGGGVPLAAAARGGYERALGADLSHVRLHTDAAAATGPVGADALTSGSHVFLRPGVAPASREGQRLMAHELTHVVQQTGAAGDAPGARTPTLGRPGIGLHVDPARESAADDVASRVSSGQAVSPSMRAQIGQAQGVQPSLITDIATGVLDTVSTAKNKYDFTQVLNGGEDPEGFVQARTLAHDAFDRLKSGKDIEYAAFLSGKYQAKAKQKDIRAMVLEYLAPSVTKLEKGDLELKHIAQAAQKPHARKTEDDPETVLNPGGFLQMLANYLFADRHVALEIKLSVENANKVGTIKVLNLDMGEISGNSGLWDALMENTFAHVAAVKDRARAQREMREILRAEGPLPRLWAAEEFKFSQHVVDDYLERLKMRESGGVDSVPVVSEYVDTKSTKNSGLAVSTHGNLTSRGIGERGRESHHTTQYLLAEFFGNDKEASRQAFPGNPADFFDAGIVFSSDTPPKVTMIEGGARTAPLKIHDLDPNSNRGDGMPAILLSARTHQRGELHVLRETRWDDANNRLEQKGTSTQSLAIENRFNNAIKTPALRPRNTSDADRALLRAEIASRPVAARNEYYNAALETYHWMRDRMIGALLEGLKREELAYYRGIAALDHTLENGELDSLYDMKVSHLEKVHSAAETNNTTVMGRSNWK